MVARLVEQHDVGTHQENACQRHAHLPAAGERTDVALHHFLAKTKPREHFTGAALERIAVEFLKPVLHLAILGDDLFHLVRAIGIGHRGLQRLQFAGDRGDGPCPVHHLGDGAAATHLADVLAEIADGDAAIGRDLAFVGQFLAGDHPEQRRLAGAVRADQPRFLALLERGGGFDEQNLVADLLGDIVETDHGSLEVREGVFGPLLRMIRKSGNRFSEEDHPQREHEGIKGKR